LSVNKYPRCVAVAGDGDAPSLITLRNEVPAIAERLNVSHASLGGYRKDLSLGCPRCLRCLP